MAGPVFCHPPLGDYELLDSGEAEKLERFGAWVLRRPDPQALWGRLRPDEEWERADLSFVRESDRGGRWEGGKGGRVPPSEWEVHVRGGRLEPGGVTLPTARLVIRPTPFKHVGLFPEQAANWAWLEERRLALLESGVERPALLNLFAYTGASTVLAALSGWTVTHVDASRSSLDLAAENARRSGLGHDAVRWMFDDAAAFAARELRRGRTYHGILLDPPHYGRGPKGEKWRFEAGIAPLLARCRRLLADGAPAALALSTYAIGYSPLAFENMLSEFGPGDLESGELALPESGSGRLLPCGFCTRFVRRA